MIKFRQQPFEFGWPLPLLSEKSAAARVSTTEYASMEGDEQFAGRAFATPARMSPFV